MSLCELTTNPAKTTYVKESYAFVAIQTQRFVSCLEIKFTVKAFLFSCLELVCLLLLLLEPRWFHFLSDCRKPLLLTVPRLELKRNAKTQRPNETCLTHVPPPGAE